VISSQLPVIRKVQKKDKYKNALGMQAESPTGLAAGQPDPRVLGGNALKLLSQLSIVCFFLCSYITNAQSVSDTAIHIYESNEVKSIVQKGSDCAHASHGQFRGYRIQINFGQDRNEANKVRGDFSAKYPGIPTYMSYQQPYFKVNVGDYRTKLEAVKNLNMVRKNYPGAFVIIDKINPPLSQ
jgi:hypothetical protein